MAIQYVLESKRGGKRRNGAHKKCAACKKEFYVPRYRIRTARFCSTECQNHSQYDRASFTCVSCGNAFTDSPSRYLKRTYCSQICRDKAIQSVVTERDKRRAVAIWNKLARGGNVAQRQIRRATFATKPKRCEQCGYDEHRFCLDVHHKDGNPLNNTSENLAVLCVICHKVLHHNERSGGHKAVAIALSEARKTSRARRGS